MITKCGRLWVNKSNRFLTLCKNNSGYLSGYIGKKELVHRIMARVFLSAKDPFVVNHKNGIKTDNNIDNLELITQAENVAHSRNLGVRGKKITVDQVVEIIKIKSETNILTKDLAAHFGLTRHAVSGIFTGLYWPVGRYPKIDAAREKYPVKIRHTKHIKYNKI